MQAALVVDAFLEADEDELIALCHFEAPLDAVALSRAQPWIDQWRLVTWCRAQNEKGVAPSTGAVLAQLESGRWEWPAAFRPPPWGPSAEVLQRRRVSRLRRRWGGRIVRLRYRDDTPLPALRGKAPWVGGGCAGWARTSDRLPAFMLCFSVRNRGRLADMFHARGDALLKGFPYVTLISGTRLDAARRYPNQPAFRSRFATLSELSVPGIVLLSRCPVGARMACILFAGTLGRYAHRRGVRCCQGVWAPFPPLSSP